MFRFDRVVSASVLLAFGLSLGACSSTGQDFDPTTWVPTSWFDKKDPLPGKREPVFPNGVPGVPEGVPPQLIKGHEQAAVATQPAPEAAEPPAEKPAPKPQPTQASKPKPKPKTASARPAQVAPAAPPMAAAPVQTQQSSGQSSAAPWPDPTQHSWPAPNPNTFSR